LDTVSFAKHQLGLLHNTTRSVKECIHGSWFSAVTKIGNQNLPNLRNRNYAFTNSHVGLYCFLRVTAPFLFEYAILAFYIAAFLCSTWMTCEKTWCPVCVLATMLKGDWMFVSSFKTRYTVSNLISQLLLNSGPCFFFLFSFFFFFQVYLYLTQEVNAEVQSMCYSLVSIVTMLCVGVIFSQVKCFRKTSSTLIINCVFDNSWLDSDNKISHMQSCGWHAVQYNLA
jgi:hypothetical protein